MKDEHVRDEHVKDAAQDATEDVPGALEDGSSSVSGGKIIITPVASAPPPHAPQGFFINRPQMRPSADKTHAPSPRLTAPPVFAAIPRSKQTHAPTFGYILVISTTAKAAPSPVSDVCATALAKNTPEAHCAL